MVLALPDVCTPEKLSAAGWKCQDLQGHMGHIGPLWTCADAQGQRSYGLLMQAQHLNPAGVVHGGALLALADHAMSVTVWRHAARQPCVTLQLDTHFLAPAHLGDFVHCTVQIRHSTRSMVFAQATLQAGPRLLLQAQGVWKVRASRDNACHD